MRGNSTEARAAAIIGATVTDDFTLGATGRATRVVTDAMTAIALGSGDVPVLGTPAVLALIEQAAVTAIQLPPQETSVGTWAELEHVAPSKVGATVTAVATLTGIDGKTLTFTAEARDGDTLIARAKHRRAIVSRDRFA